MWSVSSHLAGHLRPELILSRCGCHGSGCPDPSTSSGQRSPGSDGGLGQASRLNTLSGIRGLWGRWRKSSLANVSLGGSTTSRTHTCYLAQACRHTHHIYPAFVGQHGLIQRPDTVSAQISPSLSVTRLKSQRKESMSNWDIIGRHIEMKQQQINRKTLCTAQCWQLLQSTPSLFVFVRIHWKSNDNKGTS